MLSVEHAPRVGLDDAWTVASGVALRPEPFGALAYHFGTRRLTFLKTSELAAVVGSLAQHVDVRSALVAAAVAPSQWNAYVKALAALAEAGMLAPREQVAP